MPRKFASVPKLRSSFLDQQKFFLFPAVDRPTLSIQVLMINTADL